MHDGAMPQEVIVPVIHYRKIHGQRRKRQEQRVPRAISGLPSTGDDRISNEVTMVFDHSQEATERHTEITFALIENRYPLGEPCELRLEYITGSKTVLYAEEAFEPRPYDYDFNK